MAKQAKQTKKARRPRNPTKAVPKPTKKAQQLDIALDVWQSYEQTRSIVATAKATGHAEHVIREVLHGDTGRHLVILDNFLEACVAAWEEKQVRAHVIMDDVMDLFAGLIFEIRQAATEGRKTKILDRDGFEMTVLDAVQLLVVSKLFDQAAKCAQVAHSISAEYRLRGRAPDAIADKSGDDDFENMSDAMLAEAIRAGGIKIPIVLEKKMKLLPAP